MKLPTREQCLQWYKEIDTPDFTMTHVLLVNKVAVFLAKKLKEKGIDINLELVDKASLLHDLDKGICIREGTKLKVHGDLALEILSKKGYPELGFYVRQHRGDLAYTYTTWEEKIIAYADKRVKLEIVSLKDRYDYILEKYHSDDPETGLKEYEAFKIIEKEIFSKLDIKPEELKEKMN